MPTKYFKKASPKQAIIVGGFPVMFEKINIELGVYKTDDVGIQNGLIDLFNRGIGGAFEISEAEYKSLLEKKTTNSHQHYRDVFGKNQPQIVRPDNNLVFRAAEANPVPAAPAPTPEAVPAKQAAPATPGKPQAKARGRK